MNTKENVIKRLNTGLKHERLAYKIYGIVALVLAAITMVCGAVSMVSGAYLTAEETTTTELSINGSIIADDYSEFLFEDGIVDIADDDVHIYIDGDELTFTEDDVEIFAGAAIIGVSAFYITLGAVLLAYAIVNLVTAAKINKCRLSDESTIKRTSSAGSIVLAAFFNEIALVFAIINYVIARKNSDVLEG